MSSSRDDPNVTIGRQAWTTQPTAQMLGAGTSNSATVSELGMSANPAAMRHGLKTDPPRQHTPAQQHLPASTLSQQQGVVKPLPATATAGTATATTTATTAKMVPVQTSPMRQVQAQQLPGQLLPRTAQVLTTTQQQHPVVVSSSSNMQRSVSTAIEQQRRRMAPVIRQKNVEQQQQQQQQTQGQAGEGEETAVGTPVVVQSGASQKSLPAMAVDHLKALVLGTPADALSMGPPWTKWPDFSRTNNINGIITGLWPSITEAIKQDFVMQMVPQMMADAAKQYGAGYLTALELMEFDLGQIPPRLDGVKVYDEVGDEQVLLEVALAWGSNIKVTVGATLQLLGHTFKIPLTLQKLQLHTRVRLAAQPLLEHPPYIGSAGLSLIEPPHVEFELPVRHLGGIDVMALPGVRGLFRLGLRLASRQFAVYPKGISVPLVPGGAAASGPQGMLEVHLMRVAGLRSEDLIGHSDPYVILRLRTGRVLRSRTVNNNNNPEYDETFKMLVDDTDTQVLQLIVMDEDIIGGGKVMGVAQIQLKESAAVKVPRTKVPLSLTVHKLMSPNKGIGASVLQLPIKAAKQPLSAARKGGRKAYEGMASALGVGGGKGRVTGVSKMSQVLDETGWLGPSEEYLDEKGKTAWKEDTAHTDQQQQQQLQKGQSDDIKAKYGSGTKPGGQVATPATAAAPAGPDTAVTRSLGQVQTLPGSQPMGPSSVSSSSSYVSAFSGTSGVSNSTGSRSSSPGQLAGTSVGQISSSTGPATAGGVAGGVVGPVPVTSAEPGVPGSPVAAAVAAATAAAAAAKGGQRQGPFAGACTSTTTSSSSTSSARAPMGASGLNRLDSKSAPLLLHPVGQVGQDSDFTFGSHPRSPAGPAAVAVVEPASPRSDAGSSASDITEGGTVKVSRRVKITKMLHRISRRGDEGVNPDDADAPPAEVIEHQKEAAAQEAEMAEMRGMQADMTPGETGRNLEGDQLKQIYRGTLFLELTYTPFMKAASAPTGAGASPAPSSARNSAVSQAPIMPHDKGILAVTVVRAHGLGGWQGEADPYVTLSLMDNAGAVHPGSGGCAQREMTMRSTTIYNEDSPRWNEKFDFVDVRADSVMLATVWDQATIIDAATSLKLSKERFADSVLGRVKVPVMDVANSGRIKKMWPLQGAMMGQLELIVQWIPLESLGR